MEERVPFAVRNHSHRSTDLRFILRVISAPCRTIFYKRRSDPYELRIAQLYRPARPPSAACPPGLKTTPIASGLGTASAQAGFWTTVVGPTEGLGYLLAWESFAEREEKWNALRADPELLEASPKARKMDRWFST
jgi:NIPSNAP